jgi:hypothetical protein
VAASFPGHNREGHVAFSPDGTTLYTFSLGGVLLEWDLNGDRSFGRHFALGAGSLAAGRFRRWRPPLALSPDGTMFAIRLGASTGLFSAHTLQQRASFTIRPKRHHGHGGRAVTHPAERAVAGYPGLMDGNLRLALGSRLVVK